MKDTTRILLLDGHTVQAFSVSKALYEAGMHVIIFCEKKLSYGFASRYPDRKIICPSIKKSPELFHNFLLNYLRNNPIDLILPLFDDSADLIIEKREQIEQSGIKVGLPPNYQYSLARDKGLLMEFCQENNIPHPKTILIDKKTIRKAAEVVGFPSLIKPSKSSGAIGIRYINSSDELSNYFLKQSGSQHSLTLQSYVNNPDFYFNSMLYRSANGSFSKVVTIKIQRYFPVKGGTGSYCETVDFSEIEELSRDVLNKLNWIGFADIDFVLDKDTNQLKLIEINPRIPACIHSALVSGINFPQIIVYDALGKHIPKQTYVPGKKIRYFAMDVLWFLFSKNRFKAKPSWFIFWGRKLDYQDGGWSDPFTMIAGSLMGLIKYLDPSFRKSKINNL